MGKTLALMNICGFYTLIFFDQNFPFSQGFALPEQKVERKFEMKIVIVGPGAMGCLFAGLLAESGQKDVWLLDKYEQRAKEISEKGLIIEGFSPHRITGIHATSDAAEIGSAGLILICVKSYDTEIACRSITPIVKDRSLVLSLQNGLSNVDKISAILGEDKVIAGVTSHGATMIGVGHIRHAGIGKTIIGKKKPDARLDEIANILRAASLETIVSDNIYSFIWGKLIINAAINPVTAITRLRNGDLLKCTETREFLRSIAEESALVAKAKNISLPYDDPFRAVEDTCRYTALNISSMLQDVLHGKMTEIDAINGAIVSEGIKAGMKASVNEMLVYLVKGIEFSKNWYCKK